MTRKPATIALPPRTPVPETPDAFVAAGNPEELPFSQPRPKLKRLTIDIDEALHLQFKLVATASGQDMREVMTNLIRAFVDERS